MTGSIFVNNDTNCLYPATLVSIRPPRAAAVAGLGLRRTGRRCPGQPVADRLAEIPARDRHDGNGPDPGLVQRAQHGEQIGGRLLEIAGRAEVQHHGGAGERPRSERQQRLVGCDRARIEADRAGRGIVARLLARGSAPPHPRHLLGAILQVADLRLDPAAHQTARPQQAWRRPGEVDHRELQADRAGAAVQDEIDPLPQRLCDMVRRGRADRAGRIGARRCDRQDRSPRAAPGRAGARARAGATVSRPALTSSESGDAGARGSTRVSGPGQKRAARRSAASFQQASALAAAWVPTCTISGLKRGRRLAAKIEATARSSVAIAPRPYTVSVGKATRRPARSARAAASMSSGLVPRRRARKAAMAGPAGAFGSSRHRPCRVPWRWHP